MKLNRLLLILLLFSCFSLSSCDLHKYSLKVTGETFLMKEGPYRSNSLIKRPRTSFRKGDLIFFKTDNVYDADVVVRLNGEKLDYYDYEDGLSFRFYMPGLDSEISISIEGGL